MRLLRSSFALTSMLLAIGGCSGAVFSAGGGAGAPGVAGNDGNGDNGGASGSISSSGRTGAGGRIGGSGGGLDRSDAGAGSGAVTGAAAGSSEAGANEAGASDSAGASGSTGAGGNAGSMSASAGSAGSDAGAGGSGEPLLAVSAFSPRDELAGVRATSTVVVTFNASVNPASLTTQTASGACIGTLQLSLDGFATCVGFSSAAPVMNANDTIATSTPAGALQALGVYRIRVLGTVQKVSGGLLGGEVSQTHGFTVATDSVCASALIISQVYGGGGNQAALLNADYVELHNAGATAQSLTGLSLQYASATGTTWQVFPLPSVSVPPGGYYLVQTISAGSNGSPLTPDVTASPTLDFSATSGKVALARSTTALSGTCPLADTLDLLGYGTTANCFEGQHTAVLSSATAAFRNNAGCADSNTNSTDFTITAPAPRNHTTSPNICSCSAN